jgi:hypothetical protein
MTETPIVMDIPGVQSRIDTGLQQFQQHQSDQAFLKRCLERVDQIDEWRYSTGPVFDLPPYQLQLMGFGGGKLRKKGYESLAAARTAGAYASGFVAGQHVVTIDPAESLTFSPQVTLYEYDAQRVHSTITRQPDLAVPALSKPATLVGLGATEWLDERRRLHIGVGTRGAFAVYLYRHDDDGRPRHVHLFSKGHVAQSDYELHYDANGTLIRVTDVVGSAVWPKR